MTTMHCESYGRLIFFRCASAGHLTASAAHLRAFEYRVKDQQASQRGDAVARLTSSAHDSLVYEWPQTQATAKCAVTGKQLVIPQQDTYHDESGWYHKTGEQYDLCATEWRKLSHDERDTYQHITSLAHISGFGAGAFINPCPLARVGSPVEDTEHKRKHLLCCLSEMKHYPVEPSSDRGFDKLDELCAEELRNLITQIKGALDRCSKQTEQANVPLDAIEKLRAELATVSTRMAELQHEALEAGGDQEAMLAVMEERKTLGARLSQINMGIMQHNDEFQAIIADLKPDEDQIEAIAQETAETMMRCTEAAATYREFEQKVVASIDNLTGRERQLEADQARDDEASLARKASFADEMDRRARKQALLETRILQLTSQLETERSEALRCVADNKDAERDEQARQQARETTGLVLKAGKAELEPWVDSFEPAAVACEQLQKTVMAGHDAVDAQLRTEMVRKEKLKVAYAAESHALYSASQSKLAVEMSKKKNTLLLHEHSIKDLTANFEDAIDNEDTAAARELTVEIKKKKAAVAPVILRLQQIEAEMAKLKTAPFGLLRALQCLGQSEHCDDAVRSSIFKRAGVHVAPPDSPSEAILEKEMAKENNRQGRALIKNREQRDVRDKALADAMGVTDMLQLGDGQPVVPARPVGEEMKDGVSEATVVPVAGGSFSNLFR